MLQQVMEEPRLGVAKTSMLLEPISPEDENDMSDLPDGFSPRYRVEAPLFAAKTKVQLKAKNALWPCIYAPKQLTDAEKYKWTAPEVDWVHNSMARVIQEGLKAQSANEVWIAMFIMMGSVKHIADCLRIRRA